VPKQDGYVNIGLGGMSVQLKAGNHPIQSYWEEFISYLRKRKLIDDTALDPKGHSYYLRGDVDAVRRGNAYIVGDAVGLATRDMCEGIGPAIKSARLAARSITGASEYTLQELPVHSGNSIVSRWLDRKFAGAV
jgi:flavin-dependent dehydrogenase